MTTPPINPEHLKILSEVKRFDIPHLKLLEYVQCITPKETIEAMRLACEDKDREVDRLKQYDGNDDHPERRCERCKGRNLLCWYADNDVWNKVVGGDYGIICPNCLNEIAKEKGMQPTAWRISPEGDDPEIEKLRVKLYELNNELTKLKDRVREFRVDKVITELRNLVTPVDPNDPPK